mmetsp:Transcript_12912/g.25232  ORF Transcript_12912/g.25232 Transcript_12912/m.25232 type:complete len:100 (+) Transcript_12912:1390-1689(+)
MQSTGKIRTPSLLSDLTGRRDGGPLTEFKREIHTEGGDVGGMRRRRRLCDMQIERAEWTELEGRDGKGRGIGCGGARERGGRDRVNRPLSFCVGTGNEG